MTRKQRAAELLDRLKRGPSLIDDAQAYVDGKPNAEAFFSRRMPGGPRSSYNAWFSTWIEQEILALVPELRKNKEPNR